MEAYLCVCQVCERRGNKPVSSRKFLTGVDIYMCETCFAIWYDGEADTDKIKFHSLHWPVNYLGAYRKSSYDTPIYPGENFNPEVLPE